MVIRRIRKFLRRQRKTGSSRSNNLGAFQITPYHAAIVALVSQRTPLVIAVVGANDGKIGDPLFDLVENYIHKSVHLILIEPQKILIDLILKNYEFVENKRVFNVAIGDEPTLKMYQVKRQFWETAVSGKKKERPAYSAPTGVTSMQRQHVVEWAQKHVKSDLAMDEVIEEFEVDGYHMSQLLIANALSPEIDVLQIDAEGEDDSVIYCCDLELTKPAIIYFESMNLTPERLDRLVNYLQGLNYEVFELEKDSLAIRGIRSIDHR